MMYLDILACLTLFALVNIIAMLLWLEEVNGAHTWISPAMAVVEIPVTKVSVLRICGPYATVIFFQKRIRASYCS
jgi:hypothetical protein